MTIGEQNHRPPADKDARRTESITAPSFRKRKQSGEKLVMITAYDFPSAVLADRAGVDSILVGDSVGTAVLGYDNTVPVTLEEILHHLRAVRRGVKHALLVADLPFGTYQTGPEAALQSAIRLLKEGGAQAVKLEGGASMGPTLQRLTAAGIPAMGHLGLTPQSIHALGGHRAQGKDPESARQMLEDAEALQAAGAFALVLESIPAALAARITASVNIPTIGIGAGPECDGQIQVWHDLFGLMPDQRFRHAKRYAELGRMAEDALRAYVDEVQTSRFPTKEHGL